MNAFEEFSWRGLVQDASEGAAELLAREKVTLYIGFDPTASSLHVGSLLPILALARMQRHGHSPIALVGGGTGLIGDPSGKSQERVLLTKEKVQENLEGIGEQLGRILDFDAQNNPARLINNADWLCEIQLIDFLRDIGKNFTVNYMMAKDSVKKRMEQESGLSYTEFSYLLMQSYDFLILHDRFGCTLQMGGSDQWGNITAGAELIRRMRQSKAYGVVSPLVTTASGQKFGKTEVGTVWLDADRTSPYRFYQFWLNCTDGDVIKYLKFFTWLGREEIDPLAQAMAENPAERAAQKRLASEVTEMVHGPTARDRAIESSRVLFGGEVTELSADDLLEIFDEVPSSTLDPTDLGDGLMLPELLTRAGLTPSKGAARRLIREGGAYLNNRRASDERQIVREDDFIEKRLLILRKGQKKYHLVTLRGE